jgi:hypothetical protein
MTRALSRPSFVALLVFGTVVAVLLAMAAWNHQQVAPITKKPTVSREFVQQLMNEHDEAVMMRKAKGAGLEVTELGRSDGTVITISDPTTHEIVMTRSIVRDSFGLR